MTKTQIESRLKETFTDANPEVVDLTGTEDHWQVSLSSKSFRGLSRIQQQRAVMAVFDAELKTGEVHALTIKTSVP